jgi:hypothetical protein
MPVLNWGTFAGLPGRPEKNFELLCRGAIRQNYGSYGVLRALANQPGVEFHLKLDRRCDALGDQGRFWGWQCKWYGPPATDPLNAARRNKILDGIHKSVTHVPGLTDWVLWTPHTLTKADQEWFFNIPSNMALHLWTADDFDSLLVGQAAILRGTYFGELVLTPDMLKEQHVRSVAPIRARWRPDIHQVVSAEREMRRMLGEFDAWAELPALAVDLRSTAELVKAAPAISPAVLPVVASVVNTSTQSAEVLDRIAAGIRDGDLELVRGELRSQPSTLTSDVLTAPRRLRSGNHRAAHYATNAVADCRKALSLLADVEAAFSSRIVAVLAPAGCGKTQLAAQLSTGTDARPPGLLLHGRDLNSTNTLDDLASRVSIAAQPIPGIESLLAAVDAAGQRAQRRLPVVIDGLNEAEDPRRWKPLLATLETMLAEYPYVLLVCTLRPEFAGETLPDGTRHVEMTGYGEKAIYAIHDHFQYYKIKAANSLLPIELFQHPLTLWIFCEVTNPTRQKEIEIDAIQVSLTGLFERYLDQVGIRIAELASSTHRYYAHDVRSALTTVANALWDSHARSIDMGELRCAIRDENRPWDQSLLRALESEGILLRKPSEGSGAYEFAYDRLGGHVIAYALLARRGQTDFEAWIREPSTVMLLEGDYSDRHPLAGDIVYSLVGQIPRRFHSKQLWQLADEPLRTHALRIAATLEGTNLDAVTVGALFDLVRQGDATLLNVFNEKRGTPSHPLNSDALDKLLRPLDVADRDLLWTEWVRTNQDEIIRELEFLQNRWEQGRMILGDGLRARWVMWVLTSTVRRLRDQATRALYWFGRVDPKKLFDLTIDSLTVNDAYVSERMLAATYGVVMSHQIANADFEAFLTPLLDRLAKALVDLSASAPTYHYLARRYARGIFTFAERFYQSALPDRLRNGAWTFARPEPIPPIGTSDPRADEVGQTLMMDFKNYTIGSLFDNRSNYGLDHHGRQAAVAHVLGVVWLLGWRAERFERLDRAIANEGFQSEFNGQGVLAERYGKKYGWIGFFTYAGLLEVQGPFPGVNQPFSNVDIDPSFPDQPSVDGEFTVPLDWLSPDIKDDEHWIRKGRTSVPGTLLLRDKIGGQKGPWVAVHGSVKADGSEIGRFAWAFISALVTPQESVAKLTAALNGGKRPSVTRAAPSDYYTFAGEIPWHPNFAAGAISELGLENAYSEEVALGPEEIKVEVLAHEYAWESHHSEMNQAGTARVPSRSFSDCFDLRTSPQAFDQFLPDGTRATVTLKEIDGLDGDILYIREDLFWQYVGERAVVWFAFGERELRPFPPSPPQWLVDAHRQRTNAWFEVLEEADFKLCVETPSTL